jgi:hypothetical protein
VGGGSLKISELVFGADRVHQVVGNIHAINRAGQYFGIMGVAGYNGHAPDPLSIAQSLGVTREHYHIHSGVQQLRNEASPDISGSTGNKSAHTFSVVALVTSRTVGPATLLNGPGAAPHHIRR